LRGPARRLRAPRRAARGASRPVLALPASRAPLAVTLERRRPLRRARARARRVRRPTPLLRHPRRRPPCARLCRRRQGDGDHRPHRRLRPRRPARGGRACRRRNPQSRGRRARPRRDGTPGQGVRRGRGDPRDRARPLPRAARRAGVSRPATGALTVALLAAIVVAQGLLFAQPIHSATNYDEAVYLPAVDALRHGQALGSRVFAAQFPGFYDLLRGLSFLGRLSVTGMRAALLAVVLAGTLGGFLVGRHYGRAAGGLLTAAFLTVAPPLDLFGYQVIADTPVLALTLLSLGLATLPGALAAVAAGAVFGAALTVTPPAPPAAPAVLWFVRDRILVAVGAFGVVVAAELLAHAGALGDLWTSGITYHEKARSTPEVIPNPHRQILDQIPHRTPFFWLAIAAAVIAAVLFVVRRPLGVWPLWLWVGLSVVFLLVHKPLHPNHLIEFPYALAVATGATLGGAIRLTDSRLRIATLALLAVVLAGAYVQQWHRVTTAHAHEPASNVAAGPAPRPATPRAARTPHSPPL